MNIFLWHENACPQGCRIRLKKFSGTPQGVVAVWHVTWTHYQSMHTAEHHYHGGDVWSHTWSSQTFAQLAHQYEQRPATRFSDVPTVNGHLSDALKHKLAEEELLDMEVLLRYRGIRTLRALESLETEESAVLLCKARELYDLLGIFPSSLKNTLNKLFGKVPQQGMYQGSPWTMQGGAMPYMHQQSASHGSWTQQQYVPNQRPSRPHPLTDPLDDDTRLKRTLGQALLEASEIVGWERYTECLRRLRRSDELVAASCLEAAEALAALGIRKEDVPRDRPRKQLLKRAKKAVREVLLWRCTGNALGLDSREALVRAFEEACRHATCDEDTVSQLTNGYLRMLDELAGGRPPKKSQEQAAGTAASEGSGASKTGSQAATKVPKTASALLDPMGPSSSDPVLPHPADAADLHENPKQGRSLPPARRSPGPRTRDAGHSLHMAQIMEMMKTMTRHLQEVKEQVGKLQQDRDPFPFKPFAPYDDHDDDDDGDQYVGIPRG